MNENTTPSKPVSEPPPSIEPSSEVSPGGKKKKTIEYAVRLDGVTKKFGPKVAVDALSLKIRAGHVFGLIGPNGAGKTTTFSMLAGFLQPTSGSIDMLGYSPTNVDALRSRVGVLPQDAVLPPTERVGEFLVHLARLQDIPAEKAVECAERVLAEVEGRDWWPTRCAALSHGMAKRVQLAQALLGDPEIVLLDEPTAGLDPRVAWEVRQIIRRRKGRATLVISSHNLQELEEICDAAAILDHGRVVASGSISQLTGSGEEIHIKIAAPIRVEGDVRRTAASSVPLAKVREIPTVKLAEFDDDKGELIIRFEKAPGVDAEQVIGQVLWCLLNERVRVSGVVKGKGLEQRVMELT